MTSKEGASLAEQRLVLREQLRAQRQLIAEQLDPHTGEHRSYPRSKTMRFLTKQPGLSVTLLAEVASLLLGRRYARSIATVMAVARVVRSASNSGAHSRSTARAAGERSAVT